MYWGFIAEVHENTTVTEYPKDCLISGIYFFKFEDLKKGDAVIIRKGDGTALARFGDSLTTRESFVGKANGLYSKIGAELIPMSYWDTDKPISGTTRVLVEPALTGSMKPFIPKDRHVLVAVTLGSSYEKLERGQVVIFCSPPKMFIIHRLVAHFADGRWTTQGDNNYSWMGRDGRDRVPVTPDLFIAVAHKIVDLPKPASTAIVVTN